MTTREDQRPGSVNLSGQIPFALMRLLYKPIDLLLGRIAKRLSRRLFKALWSVVDEHDPPSADAPQASWPKLLGASALQAVSCAVTHTTADRLGASAFHWLTGSWPAKRRR
ncbi:MAG: DUF4235 domain-containing protein [Solirubrobacteraceae bacterium]